MIGVIILSQGALGREFLNAAEHVLGRQSNVRAVCLDWNEELGTCGERIRSAIKDVDTGSGVVILTDMLGGTPCNAATAELDGPNIAVIAGLNLPMLLKLLTSRNGSDLAAVAAAAEDTGRKHIRRASASASRA